MVSILIIPQHQSEEPSPKIVMHLAAIDDVVTAGGSMAFDYISDYENFNFTYCIKLFSSCDGLLCIVDLTTSSVATKSKSQTCWNFLLVVDLGMTHLLVNYTEII